MLNAEQLQWIKQRAWARCLFFMAIWLVICLIGVSVPFFIIFGGIWQHSHAPNCLLVWGGFSLLVGFLMALYTALAIALLLRFSKKSTKMLRAHTRRRRLNTLSASNVGPESCSAGLLKIHAPFQYFPPTIFIYFLKKNRQVPWLCFVDGIPVASIVIGKYAELTLPVGIHDIRLGRWVLPVMGDVPKEEFCNKVVSIEIREDQPVVMVYKFPEKGCLVYWGASLLILWLFSWNPYGWFDACFGVVNTGFPPPWNAPVFNDYVRMLIGELFWIPVVLPSVRCGMKPVLEVIKPEDAPPSL